MSNNEQPKHTPEPWPDYNDVNNSGEAAIRRRFPNYVIIHRSNYERARKCVNAMKDIEHPQLFVDNSLLNATTLQVVAQQRDNLVEMRNTLIQQRDKLIEALESIEDMNPLTTQATIGCYHLAKKRVVETLNKLKVKTMNADDINGPITTKEVEYSLRSHDKSLSETIVNHENAANDAVLTSIPRKPMIGSVVVYVAADSYTQPAVVIKVHKDFTVDLKLLLESTYASGLKFNVLHGIGYYGQWCFPEELDEFIEKKKEKVAITIQQEERKHREIADRTMAMIEASEKAYLENPKKYAEGEALFMAVLGVDPDTPSPVEHPAVDPSTKLKDLVRPENEKSWVEQLAQKALKTMTTPSVHDMLVTKRPVPADAAEPPTPEYIEVHDSIEVVIASIDNHRHVYAHHLRNVLKAAQWALDNGYEETDKK